MTFLELLKTLVPSYIPNKELGDFHNLEVKLADEYDVVEGAYCWAYKFVGDKDKDLAIIKIKAGKNTPKQKILKGDKTIEGYISGNGYLKTSDKKYVFPENESCMKTLHIGDTMQWFANTEMYIFEICYPPYTDGRFENITQ